RRRAGDRHAYRIADPERAPGAPAAQQVLAFAQLVEIVAERADVHQPLDEDLAELDEEPEAGDAAHDPVVLLSDLVLHELDSLQLQDLALGVHRHPLAPRRLLGDGRQIRGDAPAARAREAQQAVGDEIGIAPDRGREVRVRVYGEPEMAERLGRVARLLQRAQEHGVDEPRLGASLGGIEHGLEGRRGRAPAIQPESQPEALEKARQLADVLRIRWLVDAMQPGQASPQELAGDGLVRGQHALLDQAVRDAALGAHDLLRPTAEVDEDLGLGQVEVNRAAGAAA